MLAHVSIFFVKRGDIMATQGTFKEKTIIKVKEPRRYKVIMYNDDFTPMDFVVDILTDIFHKPETEAVKLMYCVHEEGAATVGTYPLDIANTKVLKATTLARQSGYPFRLRTEEA